MLRRFVVLSGVPSSGKTTLARRLAPSLELPLIDKDAILERLFESRGVGDTAWRRSLSRESDGILQAEAKASAGAMLVSFWHVPGMPLDSGTPTGWLGELPGRLVNVHCICEAEVAARRFMERERHPGHLDRESSYEKVLAGIQAIPRGGAIDIGRRVDVDTSGQVMMEAVVRNIQEAFESEVD